VTSQTFRCGHPRTPENTLTTKTCPARCRTCREAAVRSQTAKRRQERIEAGEEIRLPADGSGWDDMVAHGSRQLLEGDARYYSKHHRRAA